MCLRSRKQLKATNPRRPPSGRLVNDQESEQVMRKLILLSVLSVSACDLAIPDFRGEPQVQPAAVVVPPLVNPQSAKERFVSAAEANGCVVNSSTSAAILSSATLSVDDLGQIMQQLVTEGRGEIAADGQSFRVTTGACA
jgi:hypothetical protein